MWPSTPPENGISGSLQACQAVDSGWALWKMWKICGWLGFAGRSAEWGPSSIIGFVVGVLCQVFESFFWFGMSGLGDIRKAEGLDNFGEERGEAGLGGLGVGRKVEVTEGLGGDGADGDAQNLLWKAEARGVEEG
jgi:hypothetical protein